MCVLGGGPCMCAHAHFNTVQIPNVNPNAVVVQLTLINSIGELGQVKALKALLTVTKGYCSLGIQFYLKYMPFVHSSSFSALLHLQVFRLNYLENVHGFKFSPSLNVIFICFLFSSFFSRRRICHLNFAKGDVKKGILTLIGFLSCIKKYMLNAFYAHYLNTLSILWGLPWWLR